MGRDRTVVPPLVKTPTLLVTGELDLRTPMSQTAGRNPYLAETLPILYTSVNTAITISMPCGSGSEEAP